MNKEMKAGRLRRAMPLLLLFGPAFLLVLFAKVGCEHKFKVLDDFGKMNAYALTTSSGKVLTNKDFKGKIVIYTTIQPSCPANCATTIWHLDQILYQQLRKNKKKLGHVKIVSIVTDENGQQSDKVKEVEAILEDQIEAYDPSIWTIVKGDAKALYSMKHNGVSLIQSGKKFYGGQSYTELMLLADKKDHLRMVLSAKTESTIRAMRDHLALLEKQYDKEAYQAKHK